MSIFLVLKNNFKRANKGKGKFLLFFLIPIIAMILTIFANVLMKPSFTVGIIDNVKSEDTHRIIELLNKTSGLKVQEANQKSINTDLIMAKYSAVIEFKNNDVKTLEGYTSVYSQKNIIKESVMKLLKYYSFNNKHIDLKSISKELFEEQMSIAERIMGLVIMSLFITTTMTATIMIRDKEEGILTRFKYSPNTIYSYILGNLIYNYIITYGQLAMIAIITHIFNINIGISLINLLVLDLLIAFVATALGTFIGSVFKSEMQANIMASVISLSTGLIGGSFIPIEKMPNGIKAISNLTPTRWVIYLTSALENGEAFMQWNIAVLILVTFGMLCLVLSILKNSFTAM